MNLPSGYVLDRYRLDQVLGSPGAFGITYYATDLSSQRKVAVKELFPTDCMVRDPYGSGALLPRSGDDALAFKEALRMFEEEAKVLLQLRHQNIVQALDYFEADETGTAYLVMSYEPGYNLAHHLEQQRPGRLNEYELLKILDPLIDGLDAVHQCNFLHRDIKPSNIYITQKNKPMLLDFGAARQIVVSRTRPLTMVLTPGFAPFEQYSKALRQGPYTDIYAMGAVLYYAITDSIPDVATDRRTNDSYVPLARRLRGSEYSTPFLEAVDWALKFNAEDRPQNLGVWRSALHKGTREVPAMPDSTRFLGRMWSKMHPPTAPAPDFDPPEEARSWQMDAPPPMPGEVPSARTRRAMRSTRPPWLTPVLVLLSVLLSAAAGAGVWWWMTHG